MPLNRGAGQKLAIALLAVVVYIAMFWSEKLTIDWIAKRSGE
jgi:hypothetical protein